MSARNQGARARCRLATLGISAGGGGISFSSDRDSLQLIDKHLLVLVDKRGFKPTNFLRNRITPGSCRRQGAYGIHDNIRCCRWKNRSELICDFGSRKIYENLDAQEFPRRLRQSLAAGNPHFFPANLPALKGADCAADGCRYANSAPRLCAAAGWVSGHKKGRWAEGAATPAAVQVQQFTGRCPLRKAFRFRPPRLHFGCGAS